MFIEHMNRTGHRSQKAQAGFTLVELMVTIAVIAILAVVAAPSMSALLNANRVSASAGELVAGLQLARSEAIRRNTRVIVCATDGSVSGTTACLGSATWTNWAILDRSEADPGDRVIRNEASTGNVQVSGPTGGIEFLPSGLTDTPLAVTACVPVADPVQNQRVVNVMISGSVLTEAASSGGTCP